MNKSSMYIGIVVVSEDEDGGMSVRYHNHGPDWHELEYADTVAMEEALKPLRAEMAAIGIKAEDILHQAGMDRVNKSPPGLNK